MEKQVRHLSRFASIRPRPTKVPNGSSSIPSEYIVVRAFALDALRKKSSDGQRHTHLPTFGVLCSSRLQADRSGRDIDLGHTQANQLLMPPAVCVSYFEQKCDSPQAPRRFPYSCCRHIK